METESISKPSAAEKMERIQSHLAAGKDNRVAIVTYYKHIVCAPKHAGMFKVSGGSLYIQRGRNWDCIDYNAIRFGKMV